MNHEIIKKSRKEYKEEKARDKFTSIDAILEFWKNKKKKQNNKSHVHTPGQILLNVDNLE